MTRTEIEAMYQIDAEGFIDSEGPFKDTPMWLPFFWNAAMEGVAEMEYNGISVFHIGEGERAEFPDLHDVTRLHVWMKKDGSIDFLVFFDT